VPKKHYSIFLLTASFVIGILRTTAADVLMGKEEALRQILPQAESFEKKVIVLSQEQKTKIGQLADVVFDAQSDHEYVFHIGKLKGKIVGYVAEDTVHGKWGPIHYMMAMTPNGEVSDTIVLEYKERRGRPVAKKRFLRQYIGKTVHNPIKLRKDIDGITGATISSRGMTDGVRKLLYIFEEFFKS